MTMTFNAIAKRLFGVRYEQIWKSAFVCFVLYFSLSTIGFGIQISQRIFCLMLTMFTATILFRMFLSDDNAKNVMGLFMLPFDMRKFNYAYVGAFSAHTLITKTAPLFILALAVSTKSVWQIVGAIICCCNACMSMANIYALQKQKRVALAVCVAAVQIALCYASENMAVLLGGFTSSFIIATLLLYRIDPYVFYRSEGNKISNRKPQRSVYSIFGYLLRYLSAHKNYIVNTFAMWGIACLLPLFLGQIQGVNILPLGFGILTLNTPICILLSCNPDLEQKARFLPNQIFSFCVPYCIFIFTCNLVANAIFLISWHIQIGAVSWLMYLAAVLMAFQSAILSVVLEWLYPLRKWKIESDLWHHPRKYCVPIVMVLLSVLISTVPESTIVLLGVILFEIIGFSLVFIHANRETT